MLPVFYGNAGLLLPMFPEYGNTRLLLFMLLPYTVDTMHSRGSVLTFPVETMGSRSSRR